MSPFPAPNLLLRNKWKKEDLRKHQEKLILSRTKLDTKAPPRFIHLAIDMKRMQKEEEYQATVDYENRILLQKLSSIMRNPCRLDNWNDFQRNTHRSLNGSYRERVKKERSRENQRLVQRLSNVKPKYDLNALEEDYQRHKYRQNLFADTTKDYEINGPGRRKDGDGRSTRLSQPAPSQSDLLAAGGSEGAEEEVADDGQKAAKPKPKAKQKQKSSVQSMAENDARLLHKVVSGQSQPNDIFIRTLVRRRHAQRMKTKRKYKELYDQDLEAGLREALPRSYDALTEVLLQEGDDHLLRQARAAVEEVDALALVDLLMLLDAADCERLLAAYRKKYKADMSKDIDDHFNDDVLVAVLQALTEALTGDMSGDAVRAQEMAEELAADEEPLGADGTVLRALREHGVSQLRLLDRCCVETHSRSLAELLGERSTSKAVSVVGTAVDNAGQQAHLRAKAAFLSAHMGAADRAFIQELSTLGEVGALEAVQKEYRRLHRTPLIDDIAKRCRGDCTGVLMALAEARGKALAKPVKIEILNPPRRQPDRQATIDPSNPLLRPSQRYYAGVAHNNFKQFRRQDTGSVQAAPRQGAASPNLRGLLAADGSDRGGTVSGKSPFAPEEESRAARSHVESGAVSALGLQLCELSGGQRAAVRKRYRELFGEALEAASCGAEGLWQVLLTQLLSSAAEAQAAVVRRSPTGSAAVALLAGLGEREAAGVRQRYGAAGSDLLADLEASALGRLLARRLARRPERSFAVNEEAARRDAAALEEVAVPVPLDCAELERVMKKSASHVVQTFDLIAARRGKSLADTMDDMFGEHGASMALLVQSLGNSNAVYAKLLADALEQGDHETLISVVVMRSEIDLAKIKGSFAKAYDKKLHAAVKEAVGAEEWAECVLRIVKE